MNISKMKVGSQGKPNNSNWELGRHCASKEDAQIESRLNIEVVAALFYRLRPQCYAPSFSELNQPEASKVLQPLHFCKT